MSAQTDRELLELAAKAAGYDTHGYDMLGDVGMWVCEKGAEPFDGELPIFAWMPLADDGDALRLAVKLRLLLNVSKDGVECMGESTEWLDESLGTDPVAATRRAIVRAAAALTQGA